MSGQKLKISYRLTVRYQGCMKYSRDCPEMIRLSQCNIQSFVVRWKQGMYMYMESEESFEADPILYQLLLLRLEKMAPRLPLAFGPKAIMFLLIPLMNTFIGGLNKLL